MVEKTVTKRLPGIFPTFFVFFINKIIVGTFRSYLFMYARYIRLAALGSSLLDFRETKYLTRGTGTTVHIA